MRFEKRVIITVTTVLLAACSSDGKTQPADASNEPGIHAIAGSGVVDTVDAEPVQALVVEVHGANGAPVTGKEVKFESVPPSDTSRKNERAITACSIVKTTCVGSSFVFYDTTDSDGRARAHIRFGHFAGQVFVRVTVNALGFVDSVPFTVKPGTIVTSVRALLNDTALLVGGTITARGRTVDRYENTRPEIVAITAGAGNSVTLNSTTAVVTANQFGSQSVYFRFNNFVDSTTVRVVSPGRLVVWNAQTSTLRLVNTDGSALRTLIASAPSALGTSPHFDLSRQLISLQVQSFPQTITNTLVIDTLGATRRSTGPEIGINSILVTRLLADGQLLVVAQRNNIQGYSLWRLETDNTLTLLVSLPGLLSTIGNVDISPDGKRVAYAVATAPGGQQIRIRDVATGVITVIDPDAQNVRWSPSGSRIAFVFASQLVLINADGTGRRVVGTGKFASPPSGGLAWSPDEQYVVGTVDAVTGFGLRLMRLSDGVDVLLRFHNATGGLEAYTQADWK